MQIDDQNEIKLIEKYRELVATHEENVKYGRVTSTAGRNWSYQLSDDSGRWRSTSVYVSEYDDVKHRNQGPLS